MIGRRIEQLYGFGAARVALSGHAFNVGDPDDSLRRAGELLVHDIRQEGWRNAAGLGGAPLLGMALIALLALATVLVRPSDDHSDIELVPFELARALPPPLPVVEPVPELPPLPRPEPAIAEPVLPPPVARPKPAPPPPVAPPQRFVERSPPPAPKPAPKPPPAARPRVQIDRLASAPKPAPPPPPAQRTRRAEPQARARVAVAPLPAASAPEPVPAATAPRRRFRVAQAAAPSARARVQVDPMPSRIAAAPSEPTSRTRQRAAPTRQRKPTAARPDLALSGVRADAPSEGQPRARTRRVAPAASRDSRPAAVEVAALAAPTRGSVSGSRNAAPRSQRVGPGPAPTAGSRRSEHDEDLRGVPLGSLAACRSDREEDALKAQVVAAVTTQKECVSRAGHYRFLQTRNLNSFLMWVDRGAGRSEADRCVELRHALDCLKRSK